MRNILALVGVIAWLTVVGLSHQASAADIISDKTAAEERAAAADKELSSPQGKSVEDLVKEADKNKTPTPAAEKAPAAKKDKKAVASKKAPVETKPAIERLVLMPLRVPDEDSSLLGPMETALVQGLKEKYEVFSGEQVSQKAREIFLKESHSTTTAHKNCDETRCMQDIAEAFQAELIATANVSKRPDGYFLAISIQNIFDNKVVYSNSIPCKNCDAYQVVDKLKELSGSVLVAKKADTTFSDCPECPEMVIIPQGGFNMGGKGKAQSPVHFVAVSGHFAIGKTEITQGQWKAIMGNNPSEFKECGDRCPVENVSWFDAQSFINKLNAKTGKQYRLPTEAEWEYACRAGAQDDYCGSDKGDDVAWFGPKKGAEVSSSKQKSAVIKAVDVDGNSQKATHSVASKQPNAYGLYDMSGNVWEWVQDTAHDSYTDAPADGSEWKGDSKKHILRGGSWYHEQKFAQVDVRGAFMPESRNGSFGFRVAISR